MKGLVVVVLGGELGVIGGQQDMESLLRMREDRSIIVADLEHPLCGQQFDSYV